MNVKPVIHNRHIGLRINEDLYKKFEEAIGKGNVSKALRTFIENTVEKMEGGKKFLSSHIEKYLSKPVEREGKLEFDQRTGKYTLEGHYFGCDHKIEVYLLGYGWHFGYIHYEYKKGYYFKDYEGDKNTFELEGLQARIRY